MLYAPRPVTEVPGAHAFCHEVQGRLCQHNMQVIFVFELQSSWGFAEYRCQLANRAGKLCDHGPLCRRCPGARRDSAVKQMLVLMSMKPHNLSAANQNFLSVNGHMISALQERPETIICQGMFRFFEEIFSNRKSRVFPILALAN